MIVEDYYRQINELYGKIKEVQDQCSHPANCVIVEDKGDTGNYDPTADSYWSEHYCQLCLKKWIEEEL